VDQADELTTGPIGGSCRCDLFCRSDRGSRRENDIDLESDELGRDLGKAFGAPLRPANLDCDVSALGPAEFAQSLHKAAVHGPQVEGVAVPRNPMVCSFAGCCARAASGHATAAPPSSVMNSRRLID
jgi:hypothetical protein